LLIISEFELREADISIYDIMGGISWFVGWRVSRRLVVKVNINRNRTSADENIQKSETNVQTATNSASFTTSNISKILGSW